MFKEVCKYFPITPPPTSGFRFSQPVRKRYPTAEGDLNMDAVIEYMATSKPKGMLLAKDSITVHKKSGELHSPPPIGTKFPINRVAIWLDTSGSMSGALQSMMAFSAAFSLFARRNKVDLMFVVGVTGCHKVKAGNTKEFHDLLGMNRGDRGNAPTWKPGDMREALDWARDGKTIFITDRCIDASEITAIDAVVRAKRGICAEHVDVARIADLFWGRKVQKKGQSEQDSPSV
jgi:hypothetical protein